MGNNKETKSVLNEFLKERFSANDADTLTTGVWYSGFEKVKNYALKNNLPLVSVWSNGDACGLCTKFEGNLMTDTFRTWQKKSGCVFFFGHSKDEAKEDRTDSKKWSKADKLKSYPFVRVYLAGKVDDARSGNDWNGKKAGDKGAQILVANLTETLLNA